MAKTKQMSQDGSDKFGKTALALRQCIDQSVRVLGRTMNLQQLTGAFEAADSSQVVGQFPKMLDVVTHFNGNPGVMESLLNRAVKIGGNDGRELARACQFGKSKMDGVGRPAVERLQHFEVRAAKSARQYFGEVLGRKFVIVLTCADGQTYLL